MINKSWHMYMLHDEETTKLSGRMKRGGKLHHEDVGENHSKAVARGGEGRREDGSKEGRKKQGKRKGREEGRKGGGKEKAYVWYGFLLVLPCPCYEL